MKKLSSLIFFLIFHCLYISGQPIQFGSPQITNFTSQDYNGEDQNWHIYQDKRGIIYFANSAGILEFDGIRWKLINMPNGLTSWRVIGGADGKIIIGGSSEIGYLASDSTCNSYYKSILPQIPKKYHDFRDIWGLYNYQNQIVAITIDKILIIGENTEEIKKDAAISELGMFNNKLYISIEGKGIFYLDKNKLHNADIKNYNNCQYRRLMQLDQNKGILAGKAGGLFMMEGGKISPLTT
ncbi:MAG: hypothetical protein HC831_04415 [Chloroflexia bacterium]|nr:hypothetical protein [Chloroflexia bacterium]